MKTWFVEQVKWVGVIALLLALSGFLVLISSNQDLTKHVDSIQDQISALDGELAALSAITAKYNTDTQAQFNQRAATLQEIEERLSSRLDTVESNLATLRQEDFARLEETVGGLEADISNIRQQGTQTVEGITNDLPSAPASSKTPLSSVPESTPEEPVLPPAAPVGTSVGQSAPDFTLDNLNGESISLHEFRGHVVILDFWASWCPPCLSSMPTLEKFAAEYHDKGLVLIGVSLDRSASDASSFLKQNNYHRLIALWGSVSASQGVARIYGVSGIPHTFVIDPDGIIRFTNHPMRLSESTLDKLSAPSQSTASSQAATEPSPAPANSSTGINDKGGSTGKKVEAWAATTTLIKGRLTAPRTAKFNGGAWNVVYLEDNRYRVEASVDSQNSFGAMIRTEFQAIIRDKGDEDQTWVLESLQTNP